MADISNDPPVCKYTHSDGPPVCNCKPAECDCDHRQDVVASEQLGGSPEATRNETNRLHTQPLDRPNALLADSLKQILRLIDRTSLRGKRDHALLLMGFAAGLRAREMTTLAAGAFRHGLGSTGVAVEVRGKGSAQIVLIRRGRSRDTDPLFALHEWLAATDIRDEEALFQHIAPDGGMTSGEALAPADVGQMLRRRAADAGFDNPYLTAHSLRRGHLITMWAEGTVEL